MTLEWLSSVCAKLESGSFKNNVILEINVLPKLTLHALLQLKYVKRAHINSKFQLDVGNFTLYFIRKLEISN